MTALPRERGARVVRVSGIPRFVPCARLLGDAPWRVVAELDARYAVEASVDRGEAARLVAHLRGLGLGGAPLEVRVTPPLDRASVRRAQLDVARRARHAGPGFLRREARVDDEGRYSLTPEPIAEVIAARARAARVIDAFAGCGGNAIAFARGGARVVAIDVDEGRLALAAHNALVYGVRERLELVHGDALALLPTLEADVVFLDPPWGRRYDRRRTTLAELPTLPGALAASERSAPVTMVKLPPSFDVGALGPSDVEALFGVTPNDDDVVKMLLATLARAPQASARR